MLRNNPCPNRNTHIKKDIAHLAHRRRTQKLHRAQCALILQRISARGLEPRNRRAAIRRHELPVSELPVRNRIGDLLERACGFGALPLPRLLLSVYLNVERPGGSFVERPRLFDFGLEAVELEVCAGGPAVALCVDGADDGAFLVVGSFAHASVVAASEFGAVNGRAEVLLAEDDV